MDLSTRSTEEYIVLALSGTSAIALAPFAIYRLIITDWAIAILDFSAVLLCVSIFMYVFKTRETKTAGKLLTMMCMSVILITIYLKGVQQLLWIYPALTAIFFLINPLPAAILGIACLAILGVIIWSEINAFTLVEFYITACATLLFSFVFSDRMRAQQRKLLTLATQDPLTGVGNRRAMEEKLLDLLSHQRRDQDIPASLILMDLDRFKRVNDQYGHAIGDTILVKFAQVINARIRKTDSLYRFGGEEFVVIAENTCIKDATLLAEQLREAVESDPRLASHQVTISLGSAQYANAETAFEWLGRADKAMYQAKESGRNTCCIA